MNKTNIIKKQSLDTILFLFIISIKLISLNYVINLNEAFYILILIPSCIGSSLIIVSLIYLNKLKNRKKAFITADIIVSIIIVIDIIYNRYFSDVTSIALIKQASLVGDVHQSVNALFHISDIIYFIDIPFVLYFYKKIKNIDVNLEQIKFKRRLKCSISLLLAGIVITYGCFYFLNIDQPSITKTMYDKKYIVKVIGDVNFHAIDLYRYAERNVFKSNKINDAQKTEIKSWFDEKNETNTNAKFYNSMNGKNLIIVQLESFQGFILNRNINGQEITPNLNKLSKDSMVYTNYHYETGMGGTSDAEFLSNVSLLPAREGSVYYQYAGNDYDSLAKQLKNKGYYTSVMHANRPGFWNRTNMYNSLGFDSYENENNYVKDDVVGLGLSDKSFVNQSIIKLKEQKQPFYSFLITLSSHFPFKDSKFDGLLDAGEFNGQLMGDYLNSVKYTDEALGELIKQLKEAGLWDNSVVVFYGDHNAIPIEKKEELGKLVYGKTDISPYEWFEEQRVVMMMHFPKDSIKGTNSMPAGEMDLYPTISNLFGFKAKYTMGQDLLNKKEGYVITRAGDWENNKAAYVKSSDKVYDKATGNELSKDDYKNYFEKTTEYLEISDNVIENNLIKDFQKLHTALNN